MITFRVRGRVVSVLCGDVDPALADVELNVVLDQGRSLDPGDVVSVEAGPRRRWRVQLPAELYEGRAHHIGLQVKSNGRVLESAGFLFTGSPQILEPPTRSVRSKADVAMTNEVFCKLICHNICCLIQSQCELGVEATFWDAKDEGPRDVLPMIRSG